MCRDKFSIARKSNLKKKACHDQISNVVQKYLMRYLSTFFFFFGFLLKRKEKGDIYIYLSFFLVYEVDTFTSMFQNRTIEVLKF